MPPRDMSLRSKVFVPPPGAVRVAGGALKLRLPRLPEETRDVRLESGDLAEAWNENGQDYATVAMRFSLIDVTRDSSGQVVEGDPQARQTVTEIWTFTRRPGQEWLLSAIQQAA